VKQNALCAKKRLKKYKSKKVLEENLPPKPEKTLENIEKADVWREYYKNKYKSKKAKLTAKQSHTCGPAAAKQNPAHEVAKQELKEYVNTEAMSEAGDASACKKNYYVSSSSLCFLMAKPATSSASFSFSCIFFFSSSSKASASLASSSIFLISIISSPPLLYSFE
jgi:hypothetical protein